MSGRSGARGAWLARAAVGTVLAANVGAALSFLVRPGAHAPAFELSGVSGEAAIRGIGILFLMWNATYPPVILRPLARRGLFRIVLAQQLLGVLGEGWIWLGLPAGHTALRASLARFLVFDTTGLLLMGLAYALGRDAPSNLSEM